MNDPSRDSAPSGMAFGSAAEEYERYRLGYPAEVAHAILAYAERPVRRALEVGAGTGKATRLFARLGVHVTAVEPDPAMAALLRAATRDLPVELVVATFERFRAEHRFDLLYSAAAWHWTDAQTRWTNALRALHVNGTLALFGVPGDLADPALMAAVERAEHEFLTDWTDHPGTDWSIEQMRRVGGLTEVTEKRIARSTTVTAEEYVGRLATVSVYLALDPGPRGQALREVRAVLPDHVVIDSTVRLVLARRR